MDVSLDHVVDICLTVLVQLDVVASTLLWRPSSGCTASRQVRTSSRNKMEWSTIKIEHLDRLNVCVSESPSTGQTDEPTEDDDCDVDGAEDAELVGLLEEPVLALDDVEETVCDEERVVRK